MGMRTGAFAEYVVVEASQAVAIPKDVPLDSAALIACGVHHRPRRRDQHRRRPRGRERRGDRHRRRRAERVQGAALVGASPIVALDLSESKRAAALRFGATHALDPVERTTWRRRRARSTDGRLADCVFVTVGAKRAFEQALGLMAPAAAW